MIVISDTSPITNLLRIERINLLRDLFGSVAIPPAVSIEISFLGDQRNAVADLDWIRVVEIKDYTLTNHLVEILDRGEAEAIGLAVEISADLILIDELKGRSEAQKLGVDVTGLIGVLIRAKEKGLIPMVRPELQKLVSDARFWLSPQLISEILSSVGEN